MATSRLTFGAILSTVQTTASTITATLEAANQGVGMLTAFVEEAAHNQKFRQTANREAFLVNLINEKTIEDAQALLVVDKFIAQSDRHRELFEKRHDVYTKLLRPEAGK
ncbi:MAG: hypothetical protein J5965_04895 [Aeriscardovia sp.]|nr:hypothetical protein [Aeriscardovia sp.]